MRAITTSHTFSNSLLEEIEADIVAGKSDEVIENAKDVRRIGYLYGGLAALAIPTLAYVTNQSFIARCTIAVMALGCYEFSRGVECMNIIIKEAEDRKITPQSTGRWKEDLQKQVDKTIILRVVLQLPT